MTKEALTKRIEEYLSAGGLFNPELANHVAVRDLLIECREALREHAMREVQRLGQEIEQEPFFTEANGFPQEFVSKDRQKQAIISMTEQCAALVWERDELQKQVWLYEKNGVTCQTYRHKVEQSCSECNVQMNYTTPPQRTWVDLTDEEYTHITDTVFHTGQGLVAYYKAIEAKLKEKNT